MNPTELNLLPASPTPDMKPAAESNGTGGAGPVEEGGAWSEAFLVATGNVGVQAPGAGSDPDDRPVVDLPEPKKPEPEDDLLDFLFHQIPALQDHTGEFKIVDPERLAALREQFTGGEMKVRTIPEPETVPGSFLRPGRFSTGDAGVDLVRPMMETWNGAEPQAEIETVTGLAKQAEAGTATLGEPKQAETATGVPNEHLKPALAPEGTRALEIEPSGIPAEGTKSSEPAAGRNRNSASGIHPQAGEPTRPAQTSLAPGGQPDPSGNPAGRPARRPVPGPLGSETATARATGTIEPGTDNGANRPLEAPSPARPVQGVPATFSLPETQVQKNTADRSDAVPERDLPKMDPNKPPRDLPEAAQLRRSSRASVFPDHPAPGLGKRIGARSQPRQGEPAPAERPASHTILAARNAARESLARAGKIFGWKPAAQGIESTSPTEHGHRTDLSSSPAEQKQNGTGGGEDANRQAYPDKNQVEDAVGTGRPRRAYTPVVRPLSGTAHTGHGTETAVRPSADTGIAAGAPTSASGSGVSSTTIPQAVHYTRLAEAIAARARTLPGDGQAQVRFSLEPEDLGLVKVRIRTQGDLVRVHIVAASGHAADALQHGIARLSGQLEAAGFKNPDIQLSMDSAHDPTVPNQGAAPQQERNASGSGSGGRGRNRTGRQPGNEPMEVAGTGGNASYRGALNLMV